MLETNGSRLSQPVGRHAGAIEGALLGIPSIAMSLVTGPAEADQGTGKPKWETPMQRGAELVRRLIKVGWPEGVVLNVNFPDCEPDAVKGSVATAQGQRDPDLLRIEVVSIRAAGPITGSASSGDAPSHPRVLTSGQFVRT